MQARVRREKSKVDSLSPLPHLVARESKVWLRREGSGGPSDGPLSPRRRRSISVLACASSALAPKFYRSVTSSPSSAQPFSSWPDTESWVTKRIPPVFVVKLITTRPLVNRR